MLSNLFQTCIFLFIIICNSSCQNNKTQIQNLTKDTIKPDFDPYYIKPDSITSQFGPKSITRNIIQDKKGQFWLASWEGIICYDGEVFTNFTLKENLRKYHTFSAFEDSKGNLWFGSIGGGVYFYDGKTFKNFNSKNGLVDWVECFIEDKQGNIWIGSNIGVFRYDGKTFQAFSKENGLIGYEVHSIIEDKNGEIWIAMDAGISVFDGKKFRDFNNITTENWHNNINSKGKPFNNIRTLIEDQNGTIWIGGQDGLFSFDGKIIKNWSSEFAGFIYEDKKGIIWMASFDTQNKMKLSKKEPNSSFKIVHNEKGQIFGIMEDDKGNIWFGKEDGICCYDGKGFKNFTEK